MSKRILDYELKKVGDKEISFQITHQDYDIFPRGKFIRVGAYFNIKSLDHPQLAERRIYLRGDNVTNDLDVVKRTFLDQRLRDQYYNQAKADLEAMIEELTPKKKYPIEFEVHEITSIHETRQIVAITYMDRNVFHDNFKDEELEVRVNSWFGFAYNWLELPEEGRDSTRGFIKTSRDSDRFKEMLIRLQKLQEKYAYKPEPKELTKEQRLELISELAQSGDIDKIKEVMEGL